MQSHSPSLSLRCRWRWGLRVLAALAGAGGGWVASAEVGLELRIPRAGTQVLGDATPLVWRFTNRGAQTLGFMWEGCCRLNGRLIVTRDGTVVDGVPSSQALAHMFAKAERLEPGIPRDYETLVSDWVHLPGTGAYQLQGSYRGVLSNQFPQLPRGLGLWRDAAQSAPVTLRVLSVADYLDQRLARESERGLSLALSGDSRLPALRPAVFTVSVSNALASPVTLRWPEEFSVWIVDREGRRVAPSVVLNDSSAPWEIPGRGAASRDFQIAPDRVEGEPLGDYRVFVDLAEGGPGRPRVPSAVRDFRWRLEREEVIALVETAARGAGTGARNAPLKLLRVYCGELGGALDEASRHAGTPESRALASRLGLASRLKPVAPVPGVVKLGVRLSPDGSLAWTEPRVASALGAGEWATQWDQVMAVRRDLGWEVQLEFVPDAATSMSRVIRGLPPLRNRVAASGIPLMSQLGDAPAARGPVLVFWDQPAPSTEAGTLRVGRSQWIWEVPQSGAVTGANDSDLDLGRLERLLSESGSGPGRSGVPVFVDAEMTWGQVRRLLERVSPAGARWSLEVGPSPLPR